MLIFRKCCIQVSENTTFLFSDFAAYLFSGYTLAKAMLEGLYILDQNGH